MSIRSTNTVTKRDKKLLDLCSSTETRGSYTHYFPDNENFSLTSMTVLEVLRYQNYLIENGLRTRGAKVSGVGRYLIMSESLESAIQYLGLSKENIKFTEQTQDILIIGRLEQQRQYLEWKSGLLSDQQFQYNLAQEFYTVPLPGSRTSRESAFGGNAYHDSGTFLQELTDIRRLG